MGLSKNLVLNPLLRLQLALLAPSRNPAIRQQLRVQNQLRAVEIKLIRENIKMKLNMKETLHGRWRDVQTEHPAGQKIQPGIEDQL
jgi:ribosomal protein S1